MNVEGQRRILKLDERNKETHMPTRASEENIHSGRHSLSAYDLVNERDTLNLKHQDIAH